MQVKNNNKNKNLEIDWFGAIWWKRDIADQNNVPRATFCYWWKKFDGDCVKVKAAMDAYVSKQTVVRGDLAHLNPGARRIEAFVKNITHPK